MNGALTIGEALGVFAPVKRGHLALGSELTLSVAGAELNVAVALARLGIPTRFAGAVGQDRTGQLILHALLAEGVDISNLEVLPGATGHFIKEQYGLLSESNIYYLRQGSAMTQWHIPVSLPISWQELSWVHTTAINWMLGKHLRAQMQQLLEAMSGSLRAVLSVDLNVRQKLGPLSLWRQAVADIMPYVAVLFASEAELRLIWDIDDPATLWKNHHLTSEQTLVVKAPHYGAQVWHSGHKEATVPRLTVSQVVDVVGAGDGFAAGVIAGRIRGWEWKESLALGHLVGAFAVVHPGDWEGYPTWDEVQTQSLGQWIDR